MKKNLQKISQTVIGLAIVLAITLIANAWSEPSSAPPGGNVSAPLNTSATTQTKTGKLNFTWFEDQNQPGYYADPGGNSMFYRLYGIADIRSPIFYDQDNTSYYANPSGESVFSSISLGGVARSTWPASVAEADTLQSVTDRGRSTTQNLQSPRFEDRDNASYYVDPASTSVFNTISLGGVSRSTWPSETPPGVNVYQCPVAGADLTGQTTCEGQLTTTMTQCYYDNGLGGFFYYSCTYVGKLVQ